MRLPTHYRRLAVFEPGPDFSRAVRVVETALCAPAAGEVLLRTRYSGVNASDSIAAAGGYGYDRLPFDIGIECGGEIVAVGSGVEQLEVGDEALVFGPGGYAEYRRAPAEQVFRVSEVTPELVAAFVAGITASVGLTETQSLRSGESVLVTAAAGGVGSFAVQLAKLAGNHVVATCGDDAKAARLEALGCDRVINYRKEDVAAVLAKEYSRGIDVAFESVGRRMFDVALAHLAPFGRLICIGAMSELASGTQWEEIRAVRVYRDLLGKSASIRACLLMLYPHEVWASHFDRLQQLLQAGKLRAVLDESDFNGLESVYDAVRHQQTGRNLGKVVVRHP